ncbi:hypothetical protein C8A05DRAFT_33716 [Staphylotrichum tortipilum]|uniref:Ras-associating domain-containing protein n=1 Tax=Staphylotrichum tortipilum TaxID=2831512 RepID=A0AAN6MMH9_9PEZI|nr:hypothetical protein C8A05DRAFT_33716 [Staphylotrichum longicolle]
MSFGFSVGDFLAVGKLIADITSCLKEVGGSKSEYRDVVLELDCLHKTLVHLDRLPSQQGNSLTADSIKYAALSCRRPLEEFLGKLKRYEASLGPRATGSTWKAPVDKVRFRFGGSDEIRKMQNYLSVHIGTVNILLAEHGLETMNVAQEKTGAAQLAIRERLETTNGVLAQVRDSIVGQAAALYKATTLLEQLYNLVSGEIRTSWKRLEDNVAAACVSTQQIYIIIQEIRGAVLTRPDIRWAFLQEPVLVEDALGRKFPVPSEYDFSLLDRIIRHKFDTGPGSAEVKHGDYQILDAKKRDSALSPQSRLRPGSLLLMALLVGKPPSALADRACPMPHCTSVRTIQVEGGGRVCCGVWFAETEQKRKSRNDLWEASRSMEKSTRKRDLDNDGDQEAPPAKRQKPRHDDEMEFKYVALADNYIDSEIFKSLRVSMDDPCYKVLPAALMKYQINRPWDQYGLYLVYGNEERRLGLDEKPLILFKQLDKEGKKPMFKLRKMNNAPADGSADAPGSAGLGGSGGAGVPA